MNRPTPIAPRGMRQRDFAAGFEAANTDELVTILLQDQNPHGGLVPSVLRWLNANGYIEAGRGGVKRAGRQ